MKNYELQEKQLLMFDPTESCFEYTLNCSIKDGNYMSKSVEILKQNQG